MDQRQKSVHVKAEDGRKISMYGSNYATRSADVFTALPCLDTPVPGFGRQRYHIFSGESNTVTTSSILIIACQDDTDVRVKPTASVDLPIDVRPTPVSQFDETTFGNVFLDRGQTLLIQSSADLSNTMLLSTKPIVVLSGHQCAQVPLGAEGCDHLVQQIPPNFTWGKVFFTAGLVSLSSDQIIKVANTNFGEATINVTCAQESGGDTIRNTSHLEKEKTLSFTTHPNEFCCIESNQPILVVMYAQGHSVGPQDEGDMVGDPLLLTIPPLEQYSNNFVINTQITPLLTFENYVNIIVPAEFFDNSLEARTNVRLNDSRAAIADDWHPISCFNGETCAWVTRVKVQSGTARVYNRNPDAGMAAFVYGTGVQIAYGYIAGYSLDPVSCKFILCPPQVCRNVPIQVCMKRPKVLMGLISIWHGDQQL